MSNDENVNGNASEGPTEISWAGKAKSSNSIIRRLKTDEVYRRKFILTLAVFWSYMTLGWVVLQIGTALPDLQILVGVDIETASWLFTTWSLGFVAGSLCCGILYDRINRLAVMFVCTFGVGICSICLPYSSSFSVMLILRVCCGIFCGGIDTGANTIVPSVWGSKSGQFMQVLYLSYTVGSIASPFATELFMSKVQDSKTNDTRGNNCSKITRNLSTCNDCEGFKYEMFQKPVEVAERSSKNYSSNWLLQNNVSSNNTFSDVQTEDGQIHNAFIITCVLVLCSAIPYLAMLLIGGCDIKTAKTTTTDAHVDKEVEKPQQKVKTIIVIETGMNKIDGKRKYFVLACIASVNLFYSATEDSLGDY